MGSLVGSLVGDNVGFAVGWVGFFVGELVGANVGEGVGISVGTRLGENVGAKVGALVGGDVGADVGAGVGDGLYGNGNKPHGHHIPSHLHALANLVSTQPNSKHEPNRTHSNKQLPVPHWIWISVLHESSCEHLTVTSVAPFPFIIVWSEHDAFPAQFM